MGFGNCYILIFGSALTDALFHFIIRNYKVTVQAGLRIFWLLEQSEQ